MTNYNRLKIVSRVAKWRFNLRTDFGVSSCGDQHIKDDSGNLLGDAFSVSKLNSGKNQGMLGSSAKLLQPRLPCPQLLQSSSFDSTCLNS